MLSDLPRINSKKQAQDTVNDLYLSIWKQDLFRAVPATADPGAFVVQFFLKKDNGTIEVQLTSDKMGEEEAGGLLLQILELIKPGKGEVEGFHLLEHILLRPNEIKKDKLLQLSLGCHPEETPYDPYSFWVSVLLPGWTTRFKNADFRQFFEQIFRRETPAHIAVRFCWVDLETMYKFEMLYKRWLVEKAKCTPSECHVTDAANGLIDFLNDLSCSCSCRHDIPDEKCVDCGEPAKNQAVAATTTLHNHTARSAAKPTAATTPVSKSAKSKKSK